MKWLVTGASGFLGRQVVSRLLDRGDCVRALIRPASGWNPPPHDRLEIFRGDLRHCPDLADAFDGVDGLVHLAAAVTGGAEEQFACAVVATERLLDAMAKSDARRLVLVSSFSVYDWSRAPRRFDEQVAIESSRLYERDGYAVAKTWQERVTRRYAQRHDWHLTVLRPGFIWGPGAEWCVGIGDLVGRWHVVLGPRRQLPLTHVFNCADCVVRCASDPAAIGETFNVVDDDNPSAWRFAGDYLHHSGEAGRRLPVPYHFGLATAWLAKGISRLRYGADGRLPGVLVPRRYVARFKPGRFVNDRLKTVLGWQPPLTYREALEQTYRDEPGTEPTGETDSPRLETAGA